MQQTQLGCAGLLRVDLVRFGTLLHGMAGGTFEMSLLAAESGPESGIESMRPCNQEWTGGV